MVYKQYLSDSKLIDYLEKNKNVVFEDIAKEDAKNILIKYNYINVVTPFKHYFADNNGDMYESLRDEFDAHIYSEQTDFGDYFALFQAEKEECLQFYDAIMKFELMFKSQILYAFITTNNVRDVRTATRAFEKMIRKVDDIEIYSTGTADDIRHRKNKMKNTLINKKKLIRGYTTSNGHVVDATDIYILFDRMYINDLLTIYYCLKNVQKRDILGAMSDCGLNLGASDYKDFCRRIFNLVAVRNCIMHYNSIEILLKYSDYKNKTIRNKASREKYEDILKALVYINKLDL